jgi:hypothetical protein
MFFCYFNGVVILLLKNIKIKINDFFLIEKVISLNLIDTNFLY